MKCPHCDAGIINVTANACEAKVPFGATWHALAYSCPSCQKVLSVQIDPVALKSDTIAAVKKLLGR